MELFEKKYIHIMRYRPDILVVQECEKPERLEIFITTCKPTNYVWEGNRDYKGLGIFCFSDFKLSIDSRYDRTVRYCIPVQVDGSQLFNVIAVWAKAGENNEVLCIEQVYRATEIYKDILSEGDTIIAGDFNGNQQWDSPPFYSDMLSNLTHAGLVSLYHHSYRESHGEETRHTFYMNRKWEKPFHIDYIYAPISWINRLKSFKIGPYHKWRKFSDHSPLIAEFNVN